MNEFTSCPRCNGSIAERVKFTWWGGALGPKLINHVKCGACGMKYNGKTGGSNTAKILIYSAAAGIFCFVVFFILFFVLNVAKL